MNEIYFYSGHFKCAARFKKKKQHLNYDGGKEVTEALDGTTERIGDVENCIEEQSILVNPL
jgi:hypothetical protein